MRIRGLIFIVVIAAGLWAGYWFVGSTGLRHALTGWAEDRRREGWVADYDDLSVQGFPNRFDTTLTNLTLADPDTGLLWSAPEFRLFALSYRPNHIIARWPEAFTLATPGEKLTITSTKMDGSLVFVPGKALELERSTIVAETLAIASEHGWQTGADTLRFAVARSTESPRTQHIGIEAAGFRPTADFLSGLGPIDLPESVETLRLDAAVTLDKPWDRTAIEVARPQMTDIRLTELHGRWGSLDFRAAGTLTVTPEGWPEGQVNIRAENWREMVQVAVAAGALPEELAPAVEAGLELLAGLNGQPDNIEAPLTFRGGRVAFGLIPLGAAPNLRLP